MKQIQLKLMKRRRKIISCTHNQFLLRKIHKNEHYFLRRFILGVFTSFLHRKSLGIPKKKIQLYHLNLLQFKIAIDIFFSRVLNLISWRGRFKKEIFFYFYFGTECKNLKKNQTFDNSPTLFNAIRPQSTQLMITQVWRHRYITCMLNH